MREKFKFLLRIQTNIEFIFVRFFLQSIYANDNDNTNAAFKTECLVYYRDKEKKWKENIKKRILKKK